MILLIKDPCPISKISGSSTECDVVLQVLADVRGVWMIFEILDSQPHALADGLPIAVVVVVYVFDFSAVSSATEILLDL